MARTHTSEVIQATVPFGSAPARERLDPATLLGPFFGFGLVQMPGNLEDPAAIGPGMAIALLTTLYGAVLSNMVFSPLATKLERNSAEESLVANLYMLAAGSICRKENPRRLEMLFNAMLPPARQIQFFS